MTSSRSILCFGDSNTFGDVPSLSLKNRQRYTEDKRWPGILREQLGKSWEVVEAGLNGRTTLHDDPVEGEHKNGIKALPIVLESNDPFQHIIIMLGTNDLKARFSVEPLDIAFSVGKLVQFTSNFYLNRSIAYPNILVVAPPPILEIDWLGQLFRGGAHKSAQLGAHYAEISANLNCDFIDCGEFLAVSEIDGIHLSEQSHQKLADKIGSYILKKDQN